MATEPTTTIIGNLTAAPELSYTDKGVGWVRFTVAATPRRYDKATESYTDGDTLFMRCTAWRQLAENIAETLDKGTRVVVTGRLRQSVWETREGEKRSSIDLDVEEVGPSLRFATAKVSKLARTTGNSGQPATDPNDPWNNPAPAGAAVGVGAGAASDEPPF
jgi:single-strand DNA-binding protein